MPPKPLLICVCLFLLSFLVWGCSRERAEVAGNGSAPARPTEDSAAQTGAPAPSNLPPPAYPLRVSKDGRYLVDTDERPFRIQGDSAQSLIANLTYAEADLYFTDRRARGFNTVNINLIEHKFAIKAPANRKGDAPFLRASDFSSPNETYFAFADSIIDLAASKGLLISLAPMYLGINGGEEGWWSELNSAANTQKVCYEFGRYIGKRYKNRKNIFWVIGGDYTPPVGSEGERRLHKFMEGVKAAGAKQLWAGDWNAPAVSTDEQAFASDMDLNAVYTSGVKERPGTTYEQARIAYKYSPPHPAYLKETGYEDEGWVPGDAASVRKYEYWAILGGCTAGGFFGNRDIWEFATATWWSGFKFGHGPWQKALSSPGTMDMVRLGELLDAIRWYDLVPLAVGGTKTLVTKGGGTYGKLDYVAAAATPDGKALIAYMPQPATITVDISQLKGAVRARWFDPTSGQYRNVSNDLFSNKAAQDFITPGRNSAGAQDWVLVLQTE
jgi:Protein of unknown function (DUF4038)/Putative collagen-binding domain of a collagenase